MSDPGLRRLERRAAEGRPEDVVAYAQALRRVGRGVEALGVLRGGAGSAVVREGLRGAWRSYMGRADAAEEVDASAAPERVWTQRGEEGSWSVVGASGAEVVCASSQRGVVLEGETGVERRELGWCGGTMGRMRGRAVERYGSDGVEVWDVETGEVRRCGLPEVGWRPWRCGFKGEVLVRWSLQRQATLEVWGWGGGEQPLPEAPRWTYRPEGGWALWVLPEGLVGEELWVEERAVAHPREGGKARNLVRTVRLDLERGEVAEVIARERGRLVHADRWGALRLGPTRVVAAGGPAGAERWSVEARQALAAGRRWVLVRSGTDDVRVLERESGVEVGRGIGGGAPIMGAAFYGGVVVVWVVSASGTCRLEGWSVGGALLWVLELGDTSVFVVARGERVWVRREGRVECWAFSWATAAG